MFTNLLNSVLLKKLALIPLLANNSGRCVDAWSFCSDGSCSGDCVGGCSGTAANSGYSRCSDGSCSGDCVGGCQGTPAGGF